mgnify:CR=1 FL=1
MDIEIIPCLNDNYSYLINDDETNTVAIIDPSEFSPCDKKINQRFKKLDFILNTHHHFDHVGGNTELKKKYGSKEAVKGISFNIKKNEIMIERRDA